MDDTLIKTRNAAEGPTQISDHDFRLVKDASSNTEQVQAAAPVAHLKCRVVAVNSSESKPANWITTTYSPVEIRYVPPDSELNDFFLSAAEAQFIQQIREDVAGLPGVFSSSSAAEHCKQFAEGVGTALVNASQTRWAVFAEEDGMVTLQVHSRASKRQVSFEFCSGADTINIVSIDANMQRHESECPIGDVQELRNAIVWLNPS